MPQGLSFAGGKIFVTTATSGGAYGTSLYALDAATGRTVWGPVRLSGTYYFSAAAYDSGKIFVVNYDGLMRSFDAATGTPGWSVQLPGQYSFSSAPTAVNGVVYVGGAGSGGTLYAVNEANGVVNWAEAVENGDESSPVVTDDGVYVSYAGPQTYKFDLSGGLTWRYDSGIEGGGGKTAVFYGGLLYARDNGIFVFDGATGSVVSHTGSYSNKAPAFDAGRKFTVDGSGNVQGTDLSSGNILWTFSNGSPNSIVTAPLVVNGFVYVGTSGGNYGQGSGTLFALDPVTGAQVWSDNVGAPIAGPDEQNVSQPLTGMAAGGGLLLVPTGHVLVAYSQIVHAWAAASLAAGPDGSAHLLWGNADGRTSAWTVDARYAVTSTPLFQPGAGWAARDLDVDAAGHTHLLWANPDGRMTVWDVDGRGNVASLPIFQPGGGWAAQALSMDATGDAHVLWTNPDGRAVVWDIDPAGRATSTPYFQPGGGWAARDLAVDARGAARLLWANPDGRMSVWTVPASGAVTSTPLFQPGGGWAATRLAVDGAGASRVLWVNPDGRMAVWSIDGRGAATSLPIFPPGGGWSARGLAADAAGDARVLWVNGDGRTSVWSITPAGDATSTPIYQP